MSSSDYTQNFEIKRDDEFLQRKKNFGSGSFVANLRDHIHEFLHASMDEHRTCLKETVRKMFERAKLYRENSGGGPNEGEKSLPL